MTSPSSPKGSKRHRFRQAIRHGLEVILPSPSRSTSPHPIAASGGSTVWTGLESALRMLESGADAFPPLKSATAGLLACLDVIQAAATNQEDYQELTTELATMAGILNQYMSKLGSGDPGSSAARIARSIEAEVEQITHQQGRNKGRRIFESIQDREDVTKRYRRIEVLFRQLQSDVSLRAWETTDKQFKATLLRDLTPVDDARYNSSYSTTIKRRGCTAQTREKVQAEIQDWMRDPDAAKVYWLNGMAGTGKTTIAYSLCEWLEANQLLGASFFCSRISSSCRNVNQIIPTVASQLARYSPAFRAALCKVLEDDPSAGKLNLVWQFKKLIQEPMQKVESTIPGGVVIVIDALDECEDVHGVRLVLETLLKLAVNLPVKFFVTSRPEPVILNKMLSPGGYSPSVLHLHDIEQSVVEEDIKKYLTEALGSMSPPPSDSEFEQLVKLSGKLFIYAATAARYICPDDTLVDSSARLKAMLSISSRPAIKATSTKKYQELDELYMGILKAAFDSKRLEAEELDVMRLVLGAVVCAKEPMTAQTLASLLDLSERQVSSVLQPLRSVLHVSEPGGLVSTLHASFPDYMLDQMRSGDFYCDMAQQNELMAHRCFEVMKSQLRFNICNLESSCVFDKDVPDLEGRVKKCISSALFYACQYWGEHLQLAGASTKLRDELAGFLTNRLLFWIEVLNLRQCPTLGADILLRAQEWLSTNDAPAEAQKQIAEAKLFVTQFASGACTRSTPHLYLSALPFCARSSSVYRNYWGRTRGLVHVKGTAIEQREKAALATWMTDSVVRSARFSVDGRRIVSGSIDGTVQVLDARNGDVVAGPFEGHTDEVWSVAFSPDGTRIASGSCDCTVRVWDARTGNTVVGPLKGHTDVIKAVAFSPDGTRVTSSSDDQTIRLWDACTGDSIAGPCEGHTGGVSSIAFSPDGTRIVSGSYDHTVRVWDAHSGAVVARPLEGHTNGIWSVAFSPNGTRVASGSADCTIIVWELSTGGTITASGSFIGHTDAVESVDFSPNSAQIVSGSRDYTIRVWDAQTGDIVAGPFEGHTNVVLSVAFSPDGNHIVSSSYDRTIRVWDARPGHTVSRAFQGHYNTVFSVSYSPDSASIVSGSGDQTIRVWDARTGNPIMKTQELHTDTVYSVAYSLDGSRIASGSDDHTIRVWGARGGETLAGPFKGHDGGLNSVVFSPDGSRIVSGSDDCTIRVWDSSTGDTVVGPLKGHSQRVMSVALSPDNTRIVSGSHDSTLRMWDARTGDAVLGPLEGHADGVNSVAFSPDGTHIVSGSSDHTVWVWNAQTGTAIGEPFEGHTDRVNSVAFSPDGTLIISGSNDRTVRLWNAHTGETMLGPFQGHTEEVYSVSFSFDGSRIVSGSRDYAIRVWNISGVAGQMGGHTNSVQSHAPSLQVTSTQAVPRPDNELDYGQPDASDPSKLISAKRARIYDAFAGTADFTFRNDGWITSDDIPLLCIPPDFCRHLPYPHNPLVIGPQGSAYVDYRNLLIGERWVECYIPE